MNDFYKYIEIIEKGKYFPIGTRRQWGSGVYEKIGNNEWRLVKRLKMKISTGVDKRGFPLDPDKEVESYNEEDDEVVDITDEEVERISKEYEEIVKRGEKKIEKKNSQIILERQLRIPFEMGKLPEPTSVFLEKRKHQSIKDDKNKVGYLVDNQYLIPIEGENLDPITVLNRMSEYYKRDRFLMNMRVERWKFNDDRTKYLLDKEDKSRREFAFIVAKKGEEWVVEDMSKLRGEDATSDEIYPPHVKSGDSLSDILSYMAQKGRVNEIDISPSLKALEDAKRKIDNQLEKSRKGDPIGTVKIWSGKEWEKTADGWKPRSKKREEKGFGKPVVLATSAVAIDEFRVRVAAHVKYRGKSYAVSVITPLLVSENGIGYEIHPSNLQYLNSGIKKSEDRDREILSILKKTTYSDYMSRDGEETSIQTPTNEKLTTEVDDFSDKDNDQSNYITSDKAVHKKYYNTDKSYKPISTHINIEGWSDEEKVNRVMAALQDIQGGIKQGTVRNPYELASSKVIKDSRYDYYKNSGNIYSDNTITLIEAVKRGEDVRFSDGWYIVEVDDDYLYVDITGQALEQDDEYRDMATITDRFGKALENDIEKGKAVPIGTVREKNGVKWIKTVNGWKYQGKGRKKKNQLEEPTQGKGGVVQEQNQNQPSKELSPEVKKQAIEGYAKEATDQQLKNAIDSDKQTLEVKQIAEKELENRGISYSNKNTNGEGDNGRETSSPNKNNDLYNAFSALLNSDSLDDKFKEQLQKQFDKIRQNNSVGDGKQLQTENESLKKENQELKHQTTVKGVDEKQYNRIDNLVKNSNFVSRNVKLTVDGKDASPYMTKYKGKVAFYMKDENGKKTDSFNTLDEYINAWREKQNGAQTSNESQESVNTQEQVSPQQEEQAQETQTQENQPEAQGDKESTQEQENQDSQETQEDTKIQENQEEQQQPSEEQEPQKEVEQPEIQEENKQQESQKGTKQDEIPEEKLKDKGYQKLKDLFDNNPINEGQKKALEFYNQKWEQDGNWDDMMRYYQNRSNIGDYDSRIAFQRFLFNKGMPPVVDDLLYNAYQGGFYESESANDYDAQAKKVAAKTSKAVWQSLRDYTDTGYRKIREYCQGKRYSDSYYEAEKVKNISKFIKDNKITKDRVLFRCMSNRFGNISRILALKPGQTFKDRSFSSYSNEKLGGFGTDLQITLLAKKGDNIANVANSGEKEYTVNRNTKYKVIAKGFKSMVVQIVD